MKRIFITIYVLMLIGLFLIPFGIGPIIDEVFEDEAAKADRDVARGTFYLIQKEFKGLDETQMKGRLESLQPHFGYPLGLYHMDELNIDAQDREAFLNHLVVVEDDKEMLVQLLKDSDLVLTMGGPFPGKDLEFKVIMLFLALFIVSLIVPALGWTYYVYHDIKKIESGSRRFAKGDHSARVKVSKISALVKIASAFNHMAEKSQNFLESQREIVNSVSHEIRTPLARIKFSREMLLDAIAENASGKNYLDEIGKDVEEIESLVDEILTYARFGRERGASESLPCNEMIPWLRALIREEQRTIRGKTIRYAENPSLEKVMVRFEPSYLSWAVRNLIRNAARHSEDKIQVVSTLEKNQFMIHVDDDGTGVPSSMRDKIFEPFFRSDKSRSRKSGGYGLGLAIARRIVRWHEGRILVSSSPLGGARFTLSLPV